MNPVSVLRHLYFRVKWLFLGEVALTVEEEMHDRGDAAIFPLLTAILAFSMGFAAYQLNGSGGVVQDAVVVVLMVMSMVLGLLCIVATTAAVVFVRSYSTGVDDDLLLEEGAG